MCARADQCPLLSNSVQNIAPQRMQRCATSGLMHRSKQRLYSITSSARASTVVGMVRPRVLAVLRLMTSSNLVGA
jgi:hypothetical protein